MVMRFGNLQDIMVTVGGQGFETQWRDGGLLIKEQSRIIKRIRDSDAKPFFTMYGVSSYQVAALKDKGSWYLSLVLQGPPFWTTFDANVAKNASGQFNIPIEFWGLQ